MPDGLVGGGGGVVRGGAQLLVLLSLLPLQYWLTTPGTEASRQAALGQFLSGVGSWRERLATWCGSVLAHLSARGATGSGVAKEPDEVGTQPSREEKEKGYFASSTEPRLPRASHVHFRVGQVLRHKKWGYRGVIVGWDLVAKAPSEWLDQMHPKDKPEWRSSPNYAVLVDTRDRLTPQMAYVVEENIRIVQNTRIYHPLVQHYFETFDGEKYESRPWHKKVYPLD